MLPAMDKVKVKQRIEDDFTKGLWHRDGAKPHTYYAGKNLCGDAYPSLASRTPRRLWATLSDGIYGMYCADALYLACDGELLRSVGPDQTDSLGILKRSSKIFGVLGDQMLILPDFKIYDISTGELSARSVKLRLDNVIVQNQDYVDEDGIARAIRFNTLHCEDFNFLNYFKAGDSIHLNGSEKNNGIYTIRSVEEFDLRFDENTFAAESITTCDVRIKVPELEGLCACGGRLWGFVGDTVYASAPGLADNWYRYDGDAQSSFVCKIPGNGPFTACIMHDGHPVFFKANGMVEIYGDNPLNYSFTETCLSGVMQGSGASLCSVGGDLLYLSHNGVIRCSGSTATVISEALGERLRNGVATTDGRRYYLSAIGDQGVRALYVYDTVTESWHKEDGEDIIYLSYLNGDVYAYCSDNTVRVLGQDQTGHGSRLDAANSFVEFHPLKDDALGNIAPLRLGLRLLCEKDSKLSLSVCYDGGEWEPRATISCEGQRLWYVPLQPRSCHSLGIRIDGTGEYRILSLIKEYH